MDIPIIISGREAGKLHIRTDGLYTLMEARLPPSEKLVRLWLHGEGESFSLGLLEPRQDGLRLCRRYTRNELRSLPSKIEYASDSPRRSELHGSPQQAPRDRRDSEPWHPNPDGTLYDPTRRLLAIPCALRRKDPKLRIICINGREYMVFRY